MKRLIDLPALSEQTAELKATTKIIRKCMNHLENLTSKHAYFWWISLNRNFYEVDFGPDLNDEEKYELVQREKDEDKKRAALLNNAKSSLNSILEIIEQEISDVLKIGRPKADERNFAYAVGKLLLFELSIRPTTTRDGLFASVLNIAWKALGKEKLYPLNEVRNAVNKINSVFPQ